LGKADFFFDFGGEDSLGKGVYLSFLLGGFGGFVWILVYVMLKVGALGIVGIVCLEKGR
jgi:hypothetical protein